jgi:enoyl-CoA hydratase/carnithine racemase
MVHLSFTDGLAVVTLDRPPVNAFDASLVDALAQRIRELRAAPDLGVVVLRGAGSSFCAGADINLLAAGMGGNQAAVEPTGFAASMQGLLAEWEELERPTIAVLHGAVMGAGLELALACDLRISSDSARIGLPEAALGLLPGSGGTQRLTRLIGPGRAKRLMFGCETVDGKEAERLGIIEWTAPEETLESVVAGVIEAIRARSSASLREIKRCVSLEGTPYGYEAEIDAVGRLHASAEAAQRLGAFVGGIRGET